jgi:hypothetical protein
LQLVNRAVELLAEGYLIELVQHCLVEALHDAVIRHDAFGALMFLLILSGSALW